MATQLDFMDTLGALAELEGQLVAVVVGERLSDGSPTGSTLAVLRGVVGHVELEGLDEDEVEDGRGVAFIPLNDDDEEAVDDGDPVGRAGLVVDAARFAGAIAAEEALVIYTDAMQVEIQLV